jgi:hypothetical protein
MNLRKPCGRGLRFYDRIKKKESQGKKCQGRTMIHSEAGETYKMNAHHVSLKVHDVKEETYPKRRAGVNSKKRPGVCLLFIEKVRAK